MELIKKDEVIDIIKKLNRVDGINIGNNDFAGFFYCRTVELLDAIKELYPTKVIYRKGKWITGLDEHCNYYICSECEAIDGEKNNFCYNCGAEMEAE